MSETENGTEGKAGAWTEAAKFQFLLRIVAQFREEGKTINWSKINMPGRTTKSLQNMWTKINKDISSMEEASGAELSSPIKKTPTKGRPPKKKAAAAAAATDDNVKEEDGSGEEAEKAAKSPKKRRSNGGTPRAKKVKQEETEAEPEPEAQTDE